MNKNIKKFLFHPLIQVSTLTLSAVIVTPLITSCNSAKVIKIVTLEYDTNSFNDAGIIIGDGKTMSISDKNLEMQKISIPFTFNKEIDIVEGFIQIKKLDGTVSKLLQDSQWQKLENKEGVTGGTIEFNFTNWSSINSSKTPEKITLSFNRSGFNDKPWNTVSNACKEFESKPTPTLDDAKVLCSTLGIVEQKTTKTTAKEFLQDELVGKEGVIIINNKAHTVRCIDVMHDKMVNDKGEKTDRKTALTFELVTVLSDSVGNTMRSKWDTKNNMDYTNSVLRKNLTGEGNGSLQWFKSDRTESAETRNVLSMLPNELQNSIKSVSKSVATKIGSATEYTANTYNDKLFPLTYTEMGQSSSLDVKIEGSAYKYWTDNTEQIDRIKVDAEENNICSYWLTSPNTTNDYNIWSVDGIGAIHNYDMINLYCVSFGFCI